MTTSRLIALIVLFALTGIASAVMLIRRDAESQRLLELDRLWGQIKGNEKIHLEKRKRNLILGYSFFLFGSLVFGLFCLFKLLRQMDWF